MPTDFTLGADPELVCCSKNDTKISCYSVADDDDQFGIDGSGQCLEIRPSPAIHPIAVVHNIRQLFLGQTLRHEKLLDYTWLAGSFQREWPLGGHIHFGLKKTSYDVAKKYCKALDDYVGSISRLLEDNDQAIARREEGYGAAGDCRTNDWGFEYRTPSSWITSPYIAAAILCLSKTVMYEVVNNPKFQYKGYMSGWSFASGDTSFVKLKFPEIWKDIQRMQLYQTYKIYLDFAYFLISNDMSWFPKGGMREAWGVVALTDSTNFSLETIWKKYKIKSK